MVSKCRQKSWRGARQKSGKEKTMEYDRVALEIRVHGRPVREYHHNSEIWIEGRKGSDFTLRIANLTAKRVLGVPVIDGLSVMNGEEASYDSGGYVLNPFQFMEIPGWRLDNDKVASFRFNKTGKSYAGKTGKPQNIGVIGCAFFEEKQPEIKIRYEGTPIGCKGISNPGVRSRSFLRGQSLGTPISDCNMDWSPSSNYSHSAGGMQTNCSGEVERGGEIREDSGQIMNSAVSPSLGTEFGAEMGHRVVTTTFQKAHDKPDVEMTIHYGDREELTQRGVDLEQKPVTAHRPSAFPKEETGCKPPPGWPGR